MSNSAPDTSSRVGVSAALSPGSSSLGPDARTSAVSATSLEAPGKGGKMVSEGKRKQEDDSDAVDTSRTGKKLKLEASDVEELPHIWLEAASAPAAAVENSADVRDVLRLQQGTITNLPYRMPNYQPHLISTTSWPTQGLAPQR